MNRPVGGPDWSPLGHRFEVATDQPLALTIDAGLGGEPGVLALGQGPTKLTFKDAQGYEVTTHSPYEDALIQIFHMRAVGVQVRAKTHRKLTPDLRGRGGVLIFAVQKL